LQIAHVTEADAADQAKYKLKNLEADSVRHVRLLDDMLVQLASAVPTDVMPGANDPDCRRMMRFDQGIQSNSDVSVAVTDMSVDELLAGRNSGSVVAKTPGAKAMTGKMQLGLSEQERELRTWISQLINFRNTHLALTYGDMDVSALGDDLLIIKRKYFGEIVYAVFNRSTESKTVELSFSEVANFTKTKNGKSYLGIVGAVHTFNDSPLITDDVNTYTVVIPAGGFEYIYN
jgi:glycosidase